MATATAPFLDRALPLLARGLSIIPITPREKTPIVGAKQRTQDVGTVEQWATQWPDANVAICADNDVCILESDDLPQLSQLIKNGTGRDLPVTLTACGSSENRPHFFFKHSQKSRNVGCLAAPGLFEARFSNQYVVGPGSIHPNGSVYRFLNDAPIVEIPDWLVSELVRLAMTQKTALREKIVSDPNGTIPKGSRHDTRMSEIGRLWDGKKTEQEMLELAFELNDRCDPPDQPGKVISEVRYVMSKDPNDPGPAVILGSKVKGEGDQTEPRLKALTVRQLREQVRASKSMDELVKGVLPSRSVNIIGGDSGLGKSPLLCQLAVCVAAGIPFLDHPVKQSPVIIADYENDAALLPMLETTAKAVNASESIFDDGLFVLQRPEQQEIVSEVKRTGARLVVVDSLRGLDSQAESGKSNRAAQLIAELQGVDTCWVLIHHLRKQSPDSPRQALDDDNIPILTWLENLAGHRGLINQTFTRLGIDRASRKEAELVVRGYFKGRGEFGPLYLERIYGDEGEPLGYQKLTGTSLLSLNRKAELRKVLAAGTSLTFSEIVAAVGGKSTAARLVAACRNAGLVAVTGRDHQKDRRYEFRVPDDLGNH